MIRLSYYNIYVNYDRQKLNCKDPTSFPRQTDNAIFYLKWQLPNTPYFYKSKIF